MKLSWGHKIVFAYSIFVVGILSMVFLTAMENRDLVTEDYYQEELSYQKTIDQSSNTAKLSEEIRVEQKNQMLSIMFPEQFKNESVSGNWKLYYAADKTKDFSGNLQTASGSIQIKTANHTGAYQLILNWQSNNQSYYFEKNIFLQ